MTDDGRAKQTTVGGTEAAECSPSVGLALEQANEELRRANLGLEEFAFVASHDLREPLRMINIYTQLLAQRYGDALDDQGRQFAQQVQYNVARMEELIQNVLDYSQAVHHGSEDNLPRMSLRDSVEEAITLVCDQLAATGGEIWIGELPEVFADSMQLTLVFQNLISNSLKYAHKERPPRIRIWAEPQGDIWFIHVADNGSGFEPEFAERIFGLFKRLHGREVPGTGLGLAICRRIIERFGGKIWAEAVNNESAEFIFTLKGSKGHGSSTANPAS